VHRMREWEEGWKQERPEGTASSVREVEQLSLLLGRPHKTFFPRHA
jgi:hypothetical protein